MKLTHLEATTALTQSGGPHKLAEHKVRDYSVLYLSNTVIYGLGEVLLLLQIPSQMPFVPWHKSPQTAVKIATIKWRIMTEETVISCSGLRVSLPVFQSKSSLSEQQITAQRCCQRRHPAGTISFEKFSRYLP